MRERGRCARRFVDFLRDPFDPANNAGLFDELVARFVTTDIVAPPLEDALQTLARLRELHPTTRFPDDDALRRVWPELRVATKYLIMTHDLEHVRRNVAQTLSGEYELALLMLFEPCHPVDRLYGLAACSSVVHGVISSRSLAPVAGMLSGARRILKTAVS